MTVSLTSPVTGSTQTGLTSPTYTITLDSPPDTNSRQYAVTALGGTQSGVEAHSVSQNFTITAWRPKTYKVLGTPNPVTGIVPNIANNSYRLLTRKGVLPLAGQPHRNMTIDTIINVPAGADVADPESIRAALSMHIGSLTQASAGIGDTTVSGVL